MIFFFSICAHYFANHILFLDNILAFCTEPCLFSAIWYPYIYVNTWQKQAKILAKINRINTLVISVTKSLDLFILIFHRIIFHHALRNDIYLHNKLTDFFPFTLFLRCKKTTAFYCIFLKEKQKDGFNSPSTYSHCICSIQFYCQYFAFDFFFYSYLLLSHTCSMCEILKKKKISRKKTNIGFSHNYIVASD